MATVILKMSLGTVMAVLRERLDSDSICVDPEGVLLLSHGCSLLVWRRRISQVV